jgi:tetratricopeptide (TPR) repeat protein
VIIDFPAGPKYKPRFSLHASAATIRHYNRGLAYATDCSSRALELAQQEFVRAVELDAAASGATLTINRLGHLSVGDFWQPLVRLAETIIGNDIVACASLVPPLYSMWDLIEQVLDEAEEINPASELVYILKGIFAVLYVHQLRAKYDFDVALKLDRIRTTESLWYATYLLTTGETQQALEIARSNIDKDRNNRIAWLVYSLFLYVTRQFDSALVAAKEMFDDAFSAPVHGVLLGLIMLATECYEGAREAFKWAYIAAEKQWLIGFESAWGWAPVPLHNYERSGLLLLCLVNTGSFHDQQNAEEWFGRFDKESRYFEMALGYLAFGDKRQAMTALTRAMEAQELPAVWLHLWPFLDPLRDEPDFQRLVERNNWNNR